MTNVINLNIQNFFGLKLNNTVNDVNISLGAEESDARHDFPPGQDRVIDVTPRNKRAERHVNYSAAIKSADCRRNAKAVMSPGLISRTYDRKGNAVEYYHSKGVYIDSYV